ncbi:MAG TPA: cyclopropane-fatty-acyl-phospholipid synthase family protein [Steroidobacteraceae bacterium]|jgi:cyclopropane-fatty-acyl-phospholipid synthase|nr:cyclopropane-fatty-acyl-phospholipid synthase family protein [Steroidobacteraceae bacterium]
MSGRLTQPGALVREAKAPAAPSRDETGYRGAGLAEALLRKVFQHLPFGFPVRLWAGAPFPVGAAASGAADSRFTLWFRNPWAVYTLILDKDPLRLAEAYFGSDVEIEGDLFAALRLKDHLETLKLPLGERVSALLMAHKLRRLNNDVLVEEPTGEAASTSGPFHGRVVRGHSKDENREAIHFHYDVSNEFYRLWLDRAMVYSCAYFEEADQSIDDAQQAKLEHICRKLLLEPGERLLDIGCGWGALVIHAARHYGVKAHGVTLSEKQLQVARQRIAEAGLEAQVTVELRDYRDLEGREIYDKVASVGMFEHVGLKNLPLYFDTVHRLLKPSGLFLNHGITHDQAGWDKNLSTEFINRYVFPDGQLEKISNIQGLMEDARFEIADVEALRPHYALTLRTWVQRLERRHARALEYVSEATYRVWRLYMSACALEFESGHIGIYQVLASKRGPQQARLPLTRRHLYD